METDPDLDAPNGDGGDTETPAEKPAEETVDHKAEADKWKSLSRKHEDQAKSTAKELEKLRKQHMDDNERAIEEAREAGRSEARLELGSDLVEAAVAVAAAGRLTDKQVEVLLEGLDLARYLNDDGKPDTAKVRKLVDGLVPVTSDGPRDNGSGRRIPDMGQGRRDGNSKPSVESGKSLWDERHPKKSSTV